MTDSLRVLYAIFGPLRSDIRPLAIAADRIIRLVFYENVELSALRVTKDVYPYVAKQLQCSTATAAKRVERLAHHCWERLREENWVEDIIGRELRYAPPPCEMLEYLAVYAYYQKPFYAIVEESMDSQFSLEESAEDSETSLPVTETVTCGEPPVAFLRCPACKSPIDREFQNYCDRCGQRLDWSQYGG